MSDVFCQSKWEGVRCGGDGVERLIPDMKAGLSGSSLKFSCSRTADCWCVRWEPSGNEERFCHSQPDYPQHGLHQWPDNYRWMYPPEAPNE